MSVNSHIQMPKCILKNFANNENKVHVYSFVTHTFSVEYPKNVYTEYGYYDEILEEDLSKNVERKIGMLVRRIRKEIQNKDADFSFLENNRDIILDYTRSLIYRSRNLLEEASRDSSYFKIIPQKMQKELFIYLGIHNIKRWNNLLDDFEIILVKNETSATFILPIIGMYSASLKIGKCILIPITPYLSIALLDKTIDNIEVDNSILRIEDTNVVFELNRRAARCEMNNNGVAIVAKDSEMIKNILDEQERQKG